MKVLFLNQFYWPDAAATGQLLGDVVCGVAQQGYEVTVVCGREGYANAEAKQRAAPHQTAGRVRVLRAGTARFRRTPAGRLLSYLTFVMSAAWQGLRAGDADAVVTLTTPPGLSWIGMILARMKGARHYSWEMDVYPEVAVALGYIRRSLILKTAMNVPLRRAAGVIVLGGCMAERLEQKGVPRAKIHITENWADGEKIRPLPVPGGPLTVLYSGNFGLAHDAETIREAMLQLRGNPRYRFIFAGGGPLRKELEEFCRSNGLDTVSFRPYLELAGLQENLARCHVGLVDCPSEIVT